MTWCPKGYGAGLYYTGNIYGSYSESTGLVGDQHYYPERNAPQHPAGEPVAILCPVPHP